MSTAEPARGSVKPLAPPLTARQRRGALIAGGVSFTLVQLGLGIFGMLAAIAIAIVDRADVAPTSVDREFTESAGL